MIAGVVLAGGQSKRMKHNKSELKLGKISLADHAKALLTNSGIHHVFISGKYDIVDKHQNKGPLAGIYASLLFLKKFKYVLFTPVDMPLINAQIIQQLIKHKNKNKNAVNFENHVFPLLIRNTPVTRKTILQEIENEKLSIKNALKIIGSYSLENIFSEKVFFNANTPEDWGFILNYFAERR